MHRTSAFWRIAGALALGLGVAGCASVEAPGPGLGAGHHCVDDSLECVTRRQATLKAMMADSSRGWVRQPATPHAYAAGVRLFAFRGKKKELTCEELQHGRREADAAPGALRGAAGLTPAQTSRGTMLAAEVAKELGLEMARRCKRE